MDDEAGPTPGGQGETFEAFLRSFFYGSRSNLDFKFLARLSEDEAKAFFTELLEGLAVTVDDGDGRRLADVARRWQARAYRPDDNERSRFAYDEGPFAAPTKPLAQSRLALVTSSGHFAKGDDPQPFGEPAMTQAEAEARVQEFIRETPTLSAIPVDIPPDRLELRHPGYPVRAVASDPEVALPIRLLADLAAEGHIGELSPTAYSFVGAASQLRLRDKVAPEWAERLRSDEVDVVLLVPV